MTDGDGLSGSPLTGTDVEPFDLSETGEEPADSGHVRERPRPDETDPAASGLGGAAFTQDLVNVEYVFERDDEFLPRTVDSDGILVSNGEYVGIARVTPRSWSIHTAERKHEIIRSYQSAFLSTLDFYVQIVCYPTDFDISEHIELLEERAREGVDDHPLITAGRNLYPQWLTSFLEQNDMKQREYYVVVRVDPEQLREFEDTGGIADFVRERAAVLEPLVDLFDRGEDREGASRDQCLREVARRLRQVESALSRLDVEVRRLRERDEALGVLYHYYNNYQPRRSFDVDARTWAAPRPGPERGES